MTVEQLQPMRTVSSTHDVGDGSPPRYRTLQARVTDESQSSLRKYQDLVVGARGLWRTFKYELITALGQAPGALGIVIRKKLYPTLLKRAGRGVVFGPGVTLRSPGKIAIGEDALVSDRCILDGRSDASGGISIGDRFVLGQRSMLMCKDGAIQIGDDVSINANTSLYAVGGNRLRIGDSVLIGPYVYICGTPYDTRRTDVPIARQGPSPRGGITIGSDCWIGANVTILDGVTIGRGCVIGAGAVVREDVPDLTAVTPHQRLVMMSRQQGAAPE